MNLESTSDPVFLSETVKCALIGLMRDLRGIAMATNRLLVNICVTFYITKIRNILLAYVSLSVLWPFAVAGHLVSSLIGYIRLTHHFF